MESPLTVLRDLTESLGAAVRPMLMEQSARALGDTDLVDLARVAEELGRWADAARLTIAGEVGRRSETELADDRISRRFGCGSASELLERATHISGATARARLAAARSVTARVSLTGQTLPAPLERARVALATGELGLDALLTITAALQPVRSRCAPGDLAAAEGELVRAATGDADTPPCAVEELRVMAQTWALFLDPDGVLPEDERAQRRRGVRLGRRRDGLTPLVGGLTDEVAAQFQRLLDAYLNPRVAADRGPVFVADEGVQGDGGEALGDTRTPDQKRHDALAGILSAAAGADGVPSLGGAAPTLVVTVAADQLDKPDGIAFVDGPHGAAPVPAAVARHIGCTGTIERVTLSAHGAIVSLHTVERVFNRRQRLAFGVRDAGCIIPGCPVRATWCEVHHVLEHSHDGQTHTDNGVLLCWHHHRTIDTSGWEIRMVGGAPQVRPPGWVDPQRRWRPPNAAVHREIRRATG